MLTRNCQLPRQQTGTALDMAFDVEPLTAHRVKALIQSARSNRAE